MVRNLSGSLYVQVSILFTKFKTKPPSHKSNNISKSALYIILERMSLFVIFILSPKQAIGKVRHNSRFESSLGCTLCTLSVVLCTKSSILLAGLGVRKEVLSILRRIFSLVDMITNTKFSNCYYVFKFDVVRQ